MEQKGNMNPRNVIRRIKWKSVLTVFFVFLAIILVIIGFNPFMTYKGSGDIKIRAWAEPSKVNLNDKSTIWVEIKNQGDEKIWVFLSLKSYDPTIKFLKTNTQNDNETISLGKGESRKIDFKTEISAECSGGFHPEI